jgi:hypothetical protein
VEKQHRQGQSTEVRRFGGMSQVRRVVHVPGIGSAEAGGFEGGHKRVVIGLSEHSLVARQDRWFTARPGTLSAARVGRSAA